MEESNSVFNLLQLSVTQQGILVLHWLLWIIAIGFVIFSIRNLVKTISIIGFKGANLPRATTFLMLSLFTVILYLIMMLNSISINIESLKTNIVLDLALLFLYISTREMKNAIEGLTPEE